MYDYIKNKAVDQLLIRRNNFIASSYILELMNAHKKKNPLFVSV